MKKYVNFNTEKRKNAAKTFENDFFKLMINMAKQWKIYKKESMSA